MLRLMLGPCRSCVVSRAEHQRRCNIVEIGQFYISAAGRAANAPRALEQRRGQAASRGARRARKPGRWVQGLPPAASSKKPAQSPPCSHLFQIPGRKSEPLIAYWPPPVTFRSPAPVLNSDQRSPLHSEKTSLETIIPNCSLSLCYTHRNQYPSSPVPPFISTSLRN